MFVVQSNMDQVRRQLSDIGRKQLPFALAKSLTETAREASDDEKRRMPRLFDRPIPYTVKNAIYLRRATKSNLMAEIGIKDRQAQYLKIQATGGIRRPKGRALLVPRSIRLNKYGNIPRNALRTAQAKGDTFVASKSDPRTKHLEPGIYKRGRRGKRKAGGVGSTGNTRRYGGNTSLTQLVAFEGSTRYRKQFPFQKIAERRARRVFEPIFWQNFKTAMATAR